MLVIGLTGGIVSGKTTVAQIFKELGAKVIDVDLIAREIVQPSKKAWEKIVKNFGKGILKDNQEIDRKKLGRIVFSDQVKLNLLNKITHPIIIEVIKKQLSQIRQQAKQDNKDVICIVDAPLLFEAHLAEMMDKTIVVYISEKKQIIRLQKRNGISKDEALKRIKSQIPLEEKIPLADYVIDNSKAPEDTKKEVFQVWKTLNEILQNN
jgi:dephospho-CoA kinase